VHGRKKSSKTASQAVRGFIVVGVFDDDDE